MMGRRLFSKLSRNRRGSILIELAAGVFVLMLFTIGIAKFSMAMIDTERDTRAIRSAVDLAWLLDEETDAPLQSDIDAIGNAARSLLNLQDHNSFLMHVSLYDANIANQPRLKWAFTTGEDPTNPASRTKLTPIIAATRVEVNGHAFDMRDDEKFLVVEMVRTGRGITATDDVRAYGFAVAYKTDSELGY